MFSDHFISFLPLFFFCFTSFLLFESSAAAESLYNILNYGAKPNAYTDSTPAFIRAWKSACSSPSSATVYVPPATFLLGPVEFAGPCKSSSIQFKIDGTIIASGSYDKIGSASSSTDNWIVIDRVNGLKITGGKLDGRGPALWACKLGSRTNCPSGATTLRITNSNNTVINGLKSVNSELYHVVILDCSNVKINGVSISAAGNSPNTDGIHVQRSTDVAITTTTIRTGDDCISVGAGTSGLWVERVFCGPGHGISIGSLGKGQGLLEAGVQNVTVKTVTFSGTQNGLRIKTWATHKSGYVKGVVFEHAVMRDVQNPIVIDQNYCPHNLDCPNQNSGIKISQVKYNDITGTSASEVAVNFDCSQSNPCSGIKLQDIALTYQNRSSQSYCKHAYGITSGAVVPPSCL